MENGSTHPHHALILKRDGSQDRESPENCGADEFREGSGFLPGDVSRRVFSPNPERVESLEAGRPEIAKAQRKVIGARNRHFGPRNDHFGPRNRHFDLRNGHFGPRNRHFDIRNGPAVSAMADSVSAIATSALAIATSASAMTDWAFALPSPSARTWLGRLATGRPRRVSRRVFSMRKPNRLRTVPPRFQTGAPNHRTRAESPSIHDYGLRNPHYGLYQLWIVALNSKGRSAWDRCKAGPHSEQNHPIRIQTPVPKWCRGLFLAVKATDQLSAGMPSSRR